VLRSSAGAPQASVLSNTSSTERPKLSAMRKASGREGSNRPFSMALIELRETRTRSASSAWLQPFSARSTRMRCFMATPEWASGPFSKASHAPPPDDGGDAYAQALDHHDQGDAVEKRQLHGEVIGHLGRPGTPHLRHRVHSVDQPVHDRRHH